jgi:hypothetical protein
VKDQMQHIGVVITGVIIGWLIGASMGFELGRIEQEAIRQVEIEARAKAILRTYCRGWFSPRPVGTKPPVLACFGLDLK